MATPKNKDDDVESTDKNYKLKDSADTHGIVADDALEKVNPAAAERATEDHDPHNVVKDTKNYDTSATESK